MTSGTLKGHTGLVTGAGRGIGRAVARLIATRGASVALNDLTLDAELSEAVEEAKAYSSAIPAAFDVRDHEAALAELDRIESELGPVDLLVCNAALFTFAPVFELTGAQLTRTLDTNVTAPFLLAQAIAARLIDRQAPGRIVMVTSVAAHIAGENQTAYGASKAALTMLAKCMAVALAPHQITVNCVAPGGPILTSQTHAGSQAPGFMDTVKRRVPLGRPGLPEEVAEAVGYFLSNEAAFATGADLILDGGLTLARP